MGSYEKNACAGIIPTNAENALEVIVGPTRTTVGLPIV